MNKHVTFNKQMMILVSLSYGVDIIIIFLFGTYENLQRMFQVEVSSL